MKALLVNVAINDREPALAVLREQIFPRASQAPGFVAGYWLVSDDNRGTTVLMFDSAQAAQGWARVIESQGAPWTPSRSTAWRSARWSRTPEPSDR